MTRTVKVRVAVAVSGGGSWRATGWSSEEQERAEKIMALSARSSLVDDNAIVHWLTADLPIPEPAEVEATVEGP